MKTNKNTLHFFLISHKYGNLTELVEACKRNEQRGLACLLTEECIKPRSTNEIGDGGGKWDIPREELQKDKELGRGNFGIVYKGDICCDRIQYVYNLICVI